MPGSRTSSARSTHKPTLDAGRTTTRRSSRCQARAQAARARPHEDRCAVLLRQGLGAMALIAILIAFVLTAGVASGASQPASRIVDRTVLCKTWGSGYPDPLRTLAVVGLPQPSAGHNGPRDRRGRRRPHRPRGERPGSADRQPRLVHPGRAAASSCLHKGLRSGVTDFGEQVEVPGRRHGAHPGPRGLRNPVTFSPAPDAPYLLIAKGRILEGSLAVATKDQDADLLRHRATTQPASASLFVARPRCQFVK